MPIPSQLTDPELIEAVKRCVRDERGATAVLIAHLAETDARRLHLALGYSSLFEYCCDALGLSEDATCNRIEVARASRRFPLLLDRLADGSLSLSVAKALSSPHAMPTGDAASSASSFASARSRADAISLYRRSDSVSSWRSM